jgi:murein DD-endopeptidase MepM/ murein hydrolase activator NlpD
MKNKYFTFLYIPTDNVQPRTLRARRVIVYGLLAVVLLAVGGGGWMTVKYSSRVSDAYKLAKLERQNVELQGELEALGQKIDGLHRQVAQNFDFQKKARLLANLDDLGADVTQVGVGGPDHAYLQSISSLDGDTRNRVTSAREDIDKLVRQARLQRDSYEEIMTSLEATDERLRATPSLRPVNVGFVTSRFGPRIDPYTGRKKPHRGIDYSARKGTPVFATADGVVAYSSRWREYGEVVELNHGHGFVTRFAHLEKRLVRKGQRVRRGDVIGRVGSTGRSTFAHLHYEVEKDGHRVNPLRYVVSN